MASRSLTVRSKRANPFGLYDMQGNVIEWCQDWYDSKWYLKSPLENPTGPTSGSERLGRGNCFNYNFVNTRSARRLCNAPSFRNANNGFRVVHAATPSSPASAKAPFNAKLARVHQEAWAKHLGMKVETPNSVG